MKRSTKIFMVFLSVFSVIVLNSHSPGEDVVGPNGCAECHGGGTFDGSVSITPNTGCIGINASIFLTVCVNDGDAIEAGFNIKASAGTMTAGAGSRLGWGGPTILTHNTPLLMNNGQACWTFEWLSPMQTGTVTFDVWGNALNDDDWYTGDAPYFVSSTMDVKIALPVEFTAFDVSKKDGKVILDWSTQQEKDNDYFVIERSYDGQIFEEIGKVERNGETGTGDSYSFVDMQPILEQNAYYRVLQQDIDGRFAYSSIESIFVESTSIETFEVYPTLVRNNSEINIEFNSRNDREVLFFIVDKLGRKMSAHTFDGMIGDNKIQIDIVDLESGLYYLLGGSGENMMEARGFVVK